VVKTSKTPAFEAPEWRTLLDSIPATTLRDPRDRALDARRMMRRRAKAAGIAAEIGCHKLR
jgi:hypothetical protein